MLDLLFPRRFVIYRRQLWHSNPFNIANIEAIVMAKDTASPRIRFVVDVAEVTPTPQASALIVQRLLEQLGFGSLLS
ncbi:MAG: hypothetical protein COS85_19410, partial [Armatimonadetes bacterium CG07_land_8_20_14_0_80_59_28]